MSVFWNKRTASLEPYVPGEQASGFIKLNTNENPYPPSPLVIKAIASDEKLRLYPDPTSRDLREAIAEKYSVSSIDQIFTGNGSDEILAFAFAAFFESGAKPVLFPDITYSFYPVYAKLWNIPYLQIPLNADWKINTKDYLQESGGVVLANPNAPTGILTDSSSILEIASYCKNDNKVMIVDEAYSDFSNANIISHIAGSDSKYKNILSVRTFSKSYSLAGLRVGFAIGSAELIKGLERVRDSFNSYTVGFLAQKGAAAAMRDNKYFNETCKKIIATRERVKIFLEKLNYTVLPSSSNFIFIKSPVMSGEKFFMHLRKNGILARHFKNERIKDFIRVTIGTDSDMDKFLEVCR